MSLEMFWLHLALPFHTACLFLCWHELELNIMPMFDELTVQCAVHGKYLLAGVLLFFKLSVHNPSPRQSKLIGIKSKYPWLMLNTKNIIFQLTPM